MLFDLGTNDELTNHLCSALVQVVSGSHRVDARKIADWLHDINIIFLFDVLLVHNYGRVSKYLLFLWLLWLLGRSFFVNPLKTSWVFVLQTLKKTSNTVYSDWNISVHWRSHRSGANNVAVKVLNLQMGKTGANEVIFVKNGSVLNNPLKFKQQTILDKFSLQKASLVDGAVEKALKAYVPKEIGTILFSKKVLLEIPSEVCKLFLEYCQRFHFVMILDLILKETMWKFDVSVILLK